MRKHTALPKVVIRVDNETACAVDAICHTEGQCRADVVRGLISDGLQARGGRPFYMSTCRRNKRYRVVQSRESSGRRSTADRHLCFAIPIDAERAIDESARVAGAKPLAFMRGLLLDGLAMRRAKERSP